MYVVTLFEDLNRVNVGERTHGRVDARSTNLENLLSHLTYTILLVYVTFLTYVADLCWF